MNLNATRVLAFAIGLGMSLPDAAQAHKAGENHDTDEVACCLFGSIAGTPGTPGGIEGNLPGGPTAFCNNPDIQFKENSGRIGDQRFVPPKCDKITSGPENAGAELGHRLGKVGVSCHYGTVGFNTMCANAAKRCEDERCGKR